MYRNENRIERLTLLKKKGITRKCQFQFVTVNDAKLVYMGLRYILLSYNASSLSPKLELGVNHICKGLQNFRSSAFFPLSFSTYDKR